MAHFIVKVDRHRTLTIPAVVHNNWGTRGCGTFATPIQGVTLEELPIVGHQKTDDFLRECMAYSVNEGFGVDRPDRGIISADCRAIWGARHPRITWEYIP